MQIISFINHKGGVGKTTSVINIGAILAAINKKVLLVDLDSQGNLSTGIRLPKNSASIYDVLVKKKDINDIIYKSYLPNIDVIPASIYLSGLEIQDNLKDLFSGLKKNYDYILVDCPPSLGMLMVSAILFADEVIIPFQTEFFALNGLITLFSVIKKIEKKYNRAIKIKGILPTMMDQRSRISKEILAKMKASFNIRVCDSVIPRNSKIIESNSAGEPIIIYDLNSLAAQAYLKAVQELFYL